MLTVLLPKVHLNLVLMENATKNILTVNYAKKTNNAIQITVMKTSWECAWDTNVTLTVKFVKEIMLSVTLVYVKIFIHKLEICVHLKKNVN